MRALCPGQIVRDKHKVLYAEAVKRVDREWGVGNVKVNSAGLWIQHAFPPDMILSRETFLAFIDDMLV